MREGSCEHEELATGAAGVKQKQWGRELIPVGQNLQSFLRSQGKADQEPEAHTYSLGIDLRWASVHRTKVESIHWQHPRQRCWDETVLSLAPSYAATLWVCSFAHPCFGALVYPTFLPGGTQGQECGPPGPGGLCRCKMKHPRNLQMKHPRDFWALL